MSVKLLTVDNLEFLSLKGGCTGSSESTLVKMPHCWKSHVAAHIFRSVVKHSCHWQVKFFLYRESEQNGMVRNSLPELKNNVAQIVLG